jgi:uncharacterized protein (DUF433 family)
MNLVYFCLKYGIMETIVSDPEILSGTPVFKGTRVPVKTLFDYLASGVNNLQDFLEDYPSVSTDQAKKVIEELGQRLIDVHRLAA